MEKLTRRLPIGVQSFESLRQDGYLYVDKTKYVYELVHTSKQYVYIFEFKLDKSANEALAQIEEKGYAEPYVADARKIYKIGVNFDSKERNITEWKVKV